MTGLSSPGSATRKASATQIWSSPEPTGHSEDSEGSEGNHSLHPHTLPPPSPLFELSSPMQRSPYAEKFTESKMAQSTDSRDGFGARNHNARINLSNTQALVNHHSPAQDAPRLRATTYEATHTMSASDRPQCDESSEDSDVPIRPHRVARNSRQLPPGDTTPKNDHPRVPDAAINNPAQTRKKPGPRPWAAKPVLKNDMAAKMEVIREIEGFWGKNFIKTYIPKCHRPLIKKSKNGKRSIYRDPEMDPMKWLPSVLKAILMIAKLTDDKTWLKKTMTDVVRYRIKNTGNRKPQLVTTDFDVIEDVLQRGWSVEHSFGIRYKHLLNAQPKEQRQTDEDVDHILGDVGSDSEVESDDAGARLDSDDDKGVMEEAEDEYEGEDGGEDEYEGEDGGEDEVQRAAGRREESLEHAPKRGWINTAPHYPPKKVVVRDEQPQLETSSSKPKHSKQAPMHVMYGQGSRDPYGGAFPPPHMYGYGYPPPATPNISPHGNGFVPPAHGYGPFAMHGQYVQSGDARAFGNGGGPMGQAPARPPQPFAHYPGLVGHPYHPGQGFLGYHAYPAYQYISPATSAQDPQYRHYGDHSNPNTNEMSGMQTSHDGNQFSPEFSAQGASQPSSQIRTPLSPPYNAMGLRNGPFAAPPTPQIEKLDVKHESGSAKQTIDKIHDYDFDRFSIARRGDREDEEDEADEDAVRLQLEEAEAEHKLIQLRKKLALTQAKKRNSAL